MMFDDDDYHPLEADRGFRHEIAHDYGTCPSGEPLPRHTDRHGRVWVACACGKEFVLEPPLRRPAPPTLQQDIAGAIAEALDDEAWQLVATAASTSDAAETCHPRRHG